MSDKTSYSIKGVADKDRDQRATQEYGRVINSFVDAKKQVLVIRDAPDGGKNIPDCVAVNEKNLQKCDNQQNEVLLDDPLYNAAMEVSSPQVNTLNLTYMMCRQGTCFATIGGIIVYFDSGHLTNSFVQTLYPEISDAVTKAM